MRWDIWLAQPKNEQGLRHAMRIAGAACVVWTGIAGAVLWNTHRAVADEKKEVAATREQIRQVQAALPGHREDARSAAVLRTGNPSENGGVELSGEVMRIARGCGARVTGWRVGDPGANGAAPAAPQGAAPAAAPPAAAATPGAANAAASQWASVEFSCTVAGDHAALSRFLSYFAATPRLLDIRKMTWSMPGSGLTGDAGALQLQIEGTLYGRSDAGR